MADSVPDRPGDGAAPWSAFGRLWTAGAISSLGDGIRLTALPLVAVSLTDDPLLISLVTVANWSPLLLSPLAGAWADLVDRRSLLIGIDIARAVVVLLLALSLATGTAGLAIVCVAAAAMGLGETVYVVAAQSFLPAVVDSSRLAAANGRLHIAQLVFRDSAGQPLGSVVFVAAAALPFLIDGVSFLLGAALLATIGRPGTTPSTARPAERGTTPRWRVLVADGARHVRSDRLLMSLAGMLGTLNFFMGAIGALEVLYVVQWLGLPEGAFGVFLAVGALGGIAGGLLNAPLSRAFGLFPAALAAMGLVGAATLAIGLVRQPLVAAASFAALFLGAAVYQSLTVSFRQAVTAPEKLGRVNGFYRLVGTGTIPLGALAGGAVAKLMQVNIPFVAAGVGILLLAALTTRPVLRMAAQQPDTAP
ncbi:MFS transporter [Streptomyces sp. S.PNR 29]|uniref:MFS transporter n=1 Tax=Streptomyces sp. S.PNR 29 TaxID=2973805 RepID=UPI0025B1AFC9|nr:MFS transporter [Streptomyces sp. S.PNR 29]MDN0196786.1 MFS transporter [Streptomyces sp. S.PNR 29]